MKGYLKKYLEGNCTDEEFMSFVNLFAKKGGEKELGKGMKEDWDSKGGCCGETPDLSPTLHKIHFEINRRESLGRKTVGFVTYLTRIAAVLFVPLAIAFFFTIGRNGADAKLQVVSTPLASKTKFELPDGSVVFLNSGSSLSFPSQFSGSKRLVKLNGEAYFDVKKGKRPFEVETSKLTVDVLGTAFNVMAYGNTLPEVTLERGKVLVTSYSDSQRILKPGEQAVLDTASNTISVSSVETELFTSWIDNKLIFKNEPLGSLAQRLGRWYNISIDIEDKALAQKKINATIENETISEVMELLKITLPIDFEYKKDERKLILKNQQQ